MYDHVGKHLFTLNVWITGTINHFELLPSRRLPLELLIIESIVAGTLITDIYYMLSEMTLEAQ